MIYGNSISTAAMAIGVMVVAAGSVRAAEENKYPAIEGIWSRADDSGKLAFDPSKPWGAGQQAPLTPEYQAIYDQNLNDPFIKGEVDWPGYNCMPPGMPAMMNGFVPMDVVVRPEVTYILIDYILDSHRRIYTDGRARPANADPTFGGYSIGKWVDENGDGRYDVLEIETRDMKGPRTFDTSGMPLHEDNETVVKERIFLDKANPNILHDEITVTDHALTRPWTVLKSYVRNRDKYPTLGESICAGNGLHVKIGNENYYVNPDGLLAPAKKGQPAPDLRYFAPPKK